MKRKTKKQIKVQDLKPKKDAKGGFVPNTTSPRTSGPRTTGPRFGTH